MRVARRSWQEYYKGQSTTEWKLRGAALDDAIKKASPSAAMELGTYCGYSAIRIGRLLPPGGKLVSVEVDPLYAAIATKVPRPALSSAARLATALLRERARRTAGRWSSTRGWATASRSRSATSPRSSTASRPSTAWAPGHVRGCRLGGASARCPGAVAVFFEAAGCVGRSRCEPLGSSGPDGGQAAIAAVRPGRARRFRGVPPP